jgi:hypothetical protein
MPESRVSADPLDAKTAVTTDVVVGVWAFATFAGLLRD